MESANQRSYGIILSYVEILCSVVLNFLTTAVFVRLLNQSEIGLYNGIVEMLAFFAIMDFGLTATLVRYYSKFKAENNIRGLQNISNICRRVYQVISAIVIIIGTVIFAFLDDIYKNSFTAQEIFSAKKIYVILLIAIVVNFSTQVYHSILSANERFIFLRSLNICVVIFQAVVSLAVVYFFPSAVALAIVQTAFSVAQSLIKYFFCKNEYSSVLKFGDFDKKLSKEVLNFSMLVFFTTVIDQFFWRTNIQIIGMTVNTEAVAIYGNALKIATKYMLLSAVVSGIFLPKVSMLVAKKSPAKVFSDLFVKVGRVQFLVLAFILSAFAVFGRQFIRVWLTDLYADVYTITLFLILPFTVDLIQNTANVIMQARNQLKFKIFVFASISVINVVITVPVVKNFGICSSSAVTGVIYGLGNLVVMNIYYIRKLELDIKTFWNQILRIALPAVVALAVGFLIDLIPFFGCGFLNLILKVFIYAGFYATIMWFFAMNDYEKWLVNRILNKVLSVFFNIRKHFKRV